jgi:hypothetical protein
VQLSPDLQFARVLISVYSDEKGKRRAMSSLVRLQPYVRARVAERVRLRLAPELRFEYDDELERSEAVLRALGGRAGVERLLGEEAVEEAMGSAPPVSKKKKAKEVEEEEEEEEEGFFEGVGDEDDEDEDDDALDEAEAERRWLRDDPATRAAEFLATPGPFDDMFGGGGGGGDWRSVSGPLPPRRGGGSGGGRGGGGGGKRKGGTGERRRSK